MFSRIAWGILLLPLALSSAYNLPYMVSPLGSRAESVLYIILGALLYALFETFFNLPLRTYVFGHELTHALASILMGGKVHSFNVSKNGGSVSLSNTNFIIALAPYCVPIYTIFALVTYYALKFWYPAENYSMVFYALVGFSLAFHGSLTLYAIRQKQPDIEKTGVFFSLVIILFVNALFLAVLSKLLFWDAVSLRQYLIGTAKTQVHIWVWLYEKAIWLCRWAYSHSKTR